MEELHFRNLTQTIREMYYTLDYSPIQYLEQPYRMIGINGIGFRMELKH